MASFRKRGNNYEVTVSNGRFPDGRKKFKTTTFHPDPNKTDTQNMRDLQYFMMDFERSVHDGDNFDGQKMTFAQFVPEWRESYARMSIRPKTLESYDQLLKTHIIPEIGTIKIAKVKPIHLNKMYRDLSEHRKDGKEGGYPSSTIHRIHGVLSSVMSYAVKCGVIDNNPCQKATLPKEKAATLTEENYFTEKQAATFIGYLNEPFTVTRRPKNRKEYTEIHTVPEQQKIFLTMALLTGCRRSELIALQWSDIDFDRKELHIRKATTIANHELITEDPKTRKSYRKISLSDHLVDALREYRTHQLEKRLQIGSKWYDGNFVFTTWDGHQMRPETPYAAFKTILQRYNATHEEQLPDITLHGLRHTSATLLIAENTDIKTVASRLGHSRVGTTLDIYSHALESKDRAAADTLSSLIFHDAKSQ